jgi:hypothetical protein
VRPCKFPQNLINYSKRRSPRSPAGISSHQELRVNIWCASSIQGRKPNHRLQFGPKSAPISSNQESISLQTTISKSGSARETRLEFVIRRTQRARNRVCMCICVKCFIDQRAARAKRVSERENGSLKIGAAHRILSTSESAAG